MYQRGSVWYINCNNFHQILEAYSAIIHSCIRNTHKKPMVNKAKISSSKTCILTTILSSESVQKEQERPMGGKNRSEQVFLLMGEKTYSF